MTISLLCPVLYQLFDKFHFVSLSPLLLHQDKNVRNKHHVNLLIFYGFALSIRCCRFSCCCQLRCVVVHSIYCSPDYVSPKHGLKVSFFLAFGLSTRQIVSLLLFQFFYLSPLVGILPHKDTYPCFKRIAQSLVHAAYSMRNGTGKPSAQEGYSST